MNRTSDIEVLTIFTIFYYSKAVTFRMEEVAEEEMSFVAALHKKFVLFDCADDSSSNVAICVSKLAVGRSSRY